MNLSMTGDLAATYKSGSQRARVVTEAWGEHNLYCPNCSSPKLDRLAHNTHASDFSCPQCHFWFQLKGQQKPIGNSITDGAYASMMRAITTDAAPSYYFMHYDVASWTVRALLLVPHFAFPPSAIVKRPPLSTTARRAGWVGCNFALNRIPPDAMISIVRTVASPSPLRSGGEGRGEVARFINHPDSLPVGRLLSGTGVSPVYGRKDGKKEDRQDACPTFISPPSVVRERFQRIKPLQELSVKQRGWTLDVLNIVRRMSGALGERRPTFTNADIYAYERELAALHPDNRHIRDKIRQQLQVLRDTGFLTQPERGLWRVKA
jgi:type II restriction enzyme